MRAGLLRYPIIILSQIKTKGESGETEISWIEFAHTKSNVINLNGVKKESDNQITNTNVTQFVIRYNIMVVESMRIKYGDKLYKINYINKYITNNNQVIGCEYLEKS